ncbi:MAG TPA: LamG domain-containing protein [Rhizomicrobium sp.]|nr:LamG domain-containing protein [Rhizomicrobium sp.]
MLKSLSKLLVIFCLVSFAAVAEDTPKQSTWHFDNLKSIGGFKTTVEGNPQLIDTPAGKAVLFHGAPDGIWVENHPLAGWPQFTFEAIFRPDGGPEQQRWFHLASIDPKTGLAALPTGTSDPNARFTFEIRVAGDQWYLDAFTHGDTYNQGLMFKQKLHPLGKWYVVAQTYDGKTYRSYVNGELQGEATLAYVPQAPGRASIGTRMNKVDYFHGAVLEARFSPRALSPDQLLKLPASMP